MKRGLPVRILLLSLLVLVTLSVTAQAQATRTWVSGVGDDANPCSRTAPCKTFAGAISKTATAGEINVLDPGGFGGVTITKSITISSEGFEAGVLVSGTNAIIINATTTSAVVLRGLDIEGLGTGLVGIKVLGGLGSLHVEKCTINNFRGTNSSGIEVSPTTAGTMKFFVKDTIVRNNGQGTGAGILVNPGSGVTVNASLDDVRLENNLIGFRSQGAGTSNTAVNDSVAAGNTNAGFQAATATATLNIEDSVAASNGTGVACANGVVRVGHTVFSSNGAAVSAVGTLCFTFGNNDSDVDISPPFTPISPS
ncbi:MAG TPA: right-handed parallel beta-helix repeat-containing protein [Thermoanaerobaculia bacterium]|nr:right-handed parallel beta-helix repeat-containing protein [Thermoanaerobaculia bacterium]